MPTRTALFRTSAGKRCRTRTLCAVASFVTAIGYGAARAQDDADDLKIDPMQIVAYCESFGQEYFYDDTGLGRSEDMPFEYLHDTDTAEKCMRQNLELIWSMIGLDVRASSDMVDRMIELWREISVSDGAPRGSFRDAHGHSSADFVRRLFEPAAAEAAAWANAPKP